MGYKISLYFIQALLLSAIVNAVVRPGGGGNGGDKPPRLMFANRKDIRMMDTGTRRGNISIVVRDLADATALDVSLRHNIICWSDIDAEKINCRNLTKTGGDAESDTTTLVSTGLPAPEDIALDMLTKKLYWTDSENNKIEVVCLVTKLRTVLVWNDLDQPRPIAVDTSVRTMFWSDWGENPKIERASMDGKNRKVLVDQDIFWPNGIALDHIHKYLFWVDAKLHYIVRIDYNGQNRKLLLSKEGPMHPFSLAYYRGVLYWSDLQNNSIKSFRLNTSTPRTWPAKPIITPMGIAVFEEPEKPYDAVSPCDKAKCSDLCLLSENGDGYTCTCPVGVKLLNNTTCNGGIQEFLIVAKGTDIRRISLDTNDYTDVLFPFTGIKHLLAVDYWNNYIYWTDDEARKIRRGSMITYKTEDVITEEILHPDGLAIDWVGQNLYWTDAGTDRIEVSNLNGKFRKILVSRGLSEPRAVALDPEQGIMFWSDWGEKKKRIEKAFMDGSSRSNVITEDISWANGLAVDDGILYWCDAKSDKIEMSDYNGNGRKELLSRDLPHPFGFTLLGDYVYWTDWQKRTVERANKRTGDERMIIKEGFTDPMGIRAVAPARYNFTLNPCADQVRFCEHLCLFNGDRSKKSHCACASGYELSSDDRSCIRPEAFILYSTENDGEIRRLSLTSNRSDVIPVKGKSPSALDYDSYESRIYWTDSKTKSIYRGFMNGSDSERVVDYVVGNAEGLAVDWLNRNMYWTDMTRHRIEVAKLNGSFRRTIIWEKIDSPSSIVVQPNKGWLYWSSWSDVPGIEKSALDGSKRSVLVNTIGGRPYGLALDLDHLYWSDVYNEVIERIHLSSGERTVVVASSLAYKPLSIAMHQNWLYWHDDTSNSIFRLPVNTTKSQPEEVYANIRPIPMKIYDELKQSSTTWTPCSMLSCSHLCFTVPQKTLTSVCGCPNHYVLQKSNMCLPPSKFILFSSYNTVSRYLDYDAVLIGGLKNVTQAFSDATHLYVNSNGILKQLRLPESQKTVSSGLSPKLEPLDIPDGMSISSFAMIGNIIFYSSRNCINASLSNGQYLGEIHCLEHVEEQITHLKLYKAHLYYIVSNRIEKITMNGINKIVVIDTGLSEPNGFDINEDELFWSEGRSIFAFDLIQSTKKILGDRDLGAPKNIAVMDRFLYWTDAGGGIERMNKLTGEERSRIVPRTEHVTSIVHIDLQESDDCNLECTICAGDECTCPSSQVLSPDGRTCMNRQECSIGYFQCKAGHIGCIPSSSQCNGIPDCQDSSDEVNCVICPGPSCPSTSCQGNDCKPEESSSFDAGYLLIPIIAILALVFVIMFIIAKRRKPSEPSQTGSSTVAGSASTHHHLHQYPLEMGTAPVGAQSIKYTHNSSSSSSNYNELLVPHPSPVTTTHSYCCSHSNNPKKYYSYLQQKELHGGPCPTPCSTDVCDNSDIYSYSFNAPPPSITSSPNSTLRMYIPPPPSPS